MQNEVGNRPFLPRAGEADYVFVEALQSPPTHELSSDEKERVLAFERDLFAGGVGSAALQFELDGARPDLKEILALPAGVERLAPAYFLTEQGRSDAVAQGLDTVADAQTEVAVVQALTALSLAAPHKITKKVVGNSFRWVKSQYEAALTDAAPAPGIAEVYAPIDHAALVQKIAGLMAYAKFLRQAKRTVGDGTDNETLARHAIIEIYQARINAGLADRYPYFLLFNQQVQQYGTPEHRSVWQDEVGGVDSRRLDNLLTLRGLQQHFTQRLDAVRNGLALGSGSAGASRTVSTSLEAFFAATAEHDQTAAAVFTPAEVAALQDVTVDATEAQTLVAAALARTDMLSAYPYDEEADKTRSARAPDGKWQVHISSAKDTLSVSQKKALVLIGGKFDRPLPKALTTLGHELRHVLQNESSYTNSSGLLLAQVDHGKRYLVFHEAGGVAEERRLSRELFGLARRDNPHYMQALLTYEATGDELAAMRAYRDSKMQTEGVTEPTKSIDQEAVDRTMRLTRRYGGYNSQPLMYGEQALVASATGKLPAETQAYLFSEASLDLPDIARLHRFGLSTTPNEAAAQLTAVFRDEAIRFARQKLANQQ